MKSLNWKKLLGAKALLLILVHVLLFSYVLPRVKLVEVVDTEIKRVDVQNQDGSVTTTDVYQIQTRLTRNNKPRVYRNEDNWLYFKLNSADLQTVAATAKRDSATVAITSYGWRFQLLSMFPNAISIKEVAADYRHIPVFNILFLVAYFGGLGYAIMRASKAIGRARERREIEAEERRQAEEASRQVEQERRAAQATEEQDKQSKRNADIEDFLNN